MLLFQEERIIARPTVLASILLRTIDRLAFF
jgi:hypothetical protein